MLKKLDKAFLDLFENSSSNIWKSRNRPSPEVEKRTGGKMETIVITDLRLQQSKKGKPYHKVFTSNGRTVFCWDQVEASKLVVNQENLVSIEKSQGGFDQIVHVESRANQNGQRQQ